MDLGYNWRIWGKSKEAGISSKLNAVKKQEQFYDLIKSYLYWGLGERLEPE